MVDTLWRNEFRIQFGVYRQESSQESSQESRVQTSVSRATELCHVAAYRCNDLSMQLSLIYEGNLYNLV